ncbi:precorrin-3B C(17)-methyltransferase [Picrophilus oshimae]|uniref:Precorrin-3B C17-methyltransferase n=1 Tax=Picrophilus torridus (strain ATCC 700027 / DSM 9790 / JCM 10055 / NBRC 100828 / KAW 2/3) TaxID=1122961 RepID=Q6L0C4_PICTO|nr:precorrin-3B C(17)-methyltransferase [Picrophilus oshimae]AAT43578.1 precorrin-3B C17-methyltransferase [Picrophilus oshimae DSM 9789]
MTGKLYIIGIGPGSIENMTLRALNAIKDSDVVVGYSYYINLIKDLLKEKYVISNDVSSEIERAERAIELSMEKKVSLVSSGDSGIYGMAGIVLEILSSRNIDLNIEVIPGVSALNAAASLVGAPLMNDFAVVSLSDIITPGETIIKRIEHALLGDFALAVYNPRSRRRTELILKLHDLLIKYRKPETPVAVIRNAYRENESITITNIKNFLSYNIDMFTIILIGNSNSYTFKNFIITPRIYVKKTN